MALLTPFDPWKNNLCTCVKKYSLSPYTGCDHGCLYCYASSYIRDFSRPREKKDFIKRLKNEIKKILPGSTVAMSNSSDPYLPLEKKMQLTQEALKILNAHDIKLNLVTKSSLILRDLNILKKFKNIFISISITTLNDKLAKKIEPNAPLPGQRLETVKVISHFLPVAIRLDPLIYQLNTQEIDKIIKKSKSSGARQIITSTYKAKNDNFQRMSNAFKENKKLWDNLYIKNGQRKEGCIYLQDKLRKSLINNVRDACLKEGMKFSSCREGFSNLNTANCDGSSLFI